MAELPYRAEYDEWRLVTRELAERVDPFSLLAAIPRHKSYRFWRDDEGS